MRRNFKVSGILLILSIIDFALAAPVSAQEERRARVDVVHVPKDVTIVLEKRGGEELEKLAGEYFKTLGKPVESSDAHALSSSAPAVPGDHGSTNVVQAPAPNPASSTANPDPLMEQSSCSSSTSSMHARGGCFSGLSLALDADGSWRKALSQLNWDGGTDSRSFLHRPLMYDPTPSEYGLTAAQTKPYPNPSADPNFDWEYWTNLGDSPNSLAQKPGSLPKGVLEGQASGYAPSRPEFYSGPGLDAPSPSSGSGSPTWPKYKPSTEPEHEVVHGQPPSPELTDPEHQSLSANSQPVDLQSIIYAAKGKAKESRRISDTARDVGDEAQRELQPAERSLDTGE